MNEESKTPRPRGWTETEGGDTPLVIASDDDTNGGRTWAGVRPVSNIWSLRRLVRDRMSRGESPLPDGFPLPAGITLEDLLKPPPPRPGV